MKKDLKRKTKKNIFRYKFQLRKESKFYFYLRDRLLKIHKNDNPMSVAESFCLVYGLKKEIIDRLAKTIADYKEIYLANNENLEMHNNNIDNDILENIDTNALNQLNTNINNTNQNISKELMASKASIFSSNNFN